MHSITGAKRIFVGCCLTFLLASVVGHSVALGQVANPPASDILTLDRIFHSGEFSERGGWAGKWNGSNSYIALEPSKAVSEGRDFVAYNASGGERRVVVRAEQLIPQNEKKPISIDSYAFSADGMALLIFNNTQRVWRQWTRGDYWALSLTTNRLLKLGGDAKPSSLMFAKLSPDGRQVGYVQNNNLFVQDILTGRIRQLTTDGSANRINGTFDWVYEEELDLRDGWQWSPDGLSIAFWQLDTTGVSPYTLINNTDALYPTLKVFPYPKTGQTNAAARIGVVGASGGRVRWLDIPGDPRNHYLVRLNWAPDSKALLVQQLNRLQNRNRFFLVSPRGGKIQQILVDEDSAWLDAYIDFMQGSIQWLEGGRSFVFTSERDGWRHLYAVSRDGGTPRTITKGAFDVIRVVKFDESHQWVYFLASPENATQTYLYRANLDGSGTPERVTPRDQSGSHQYNIAPGAELAYHTWSSFGTPPRGEIVRLPGHEVVRPLFDNSALRTRLAALKQGQHTFFKVDVGDGTKMDGWMIKPPDFDPTKRYPVLFYAYGEPAGATVHDSWMGSDFLWYLMLAQRGYIIASVDNRGTNAPRGRAWRKAIYKKIGVLSSEDQATAARWMQAQSYVDPTRIGIWGWSGGGTTSLNVLFRYPKLYHMAMAIASVPDMHLYDSIYQERYMGLPQENEMAYRQGSPITFAGQLEGNLLLVHGTGDDNVHYQGAERLINALITANKPFTMMAYPNRSHGISEGENTSRHLYELLTRYLLTNLPSNTTHP
jgi:dipeptidyl-peptidase-4